MSNPADINRAAVERLKAAIQAKRKADETLVSPYTRKWLSEAWRLEVSFVTGQHRVIDICVRRELLVGDQCFGKYHQG